MPQGDNISKSYYLITPLYSEYRDEPSQLSKSTAQFKNVQQTCLNRHFTKDDM